MTNLSTLLANKRRELSLTKKDMAERLKIDRKTYASWEQGACNLSQLVDVCNVLRLKIQLVSDISTIN